MAVLKRKGKIREVGLFCFFSSQKTYSYFRIQFKYPYTLGVKQNVSSVLGPNPFLWCWPQPMYGSGLKYPVAMDLGKFLDSSDEDQDETYSYSRRWNQRGKGKRKEHLSDRDSSEWEDISDSV